MAVVGPVVPDVPGVQLVRGVQEAVSTSWADLFPGVPDMKCALSASSGWPGETANRDAVWDCSPLSGGVDSMLLASGETACESETVYSVRFSLFKPSGCVLVETRLTGYLDAWGANFPGDFYDPDGPGCGWMMNHYEPGVALEARPVGGVICPEDCFEVSAFNGGQLPASWEFDIEEQKGAVISQFVTSGQLFIPCWGNDTDGWSLVDDGLLRAVWLQGSGPRCLSNSGYYGNCGSGGCASNAPLLPRATPAACAEGVVVSYLQEWSVQFDGDSVTVFRDPWEPLFDAIAGGVGVAGGGANLGSCRAS